MLIWLLLLLLFLSLLSFRVERGGVASYSSSPLFAFPTLQARRFWQSRRKKTGTCLRWTLKQEGRRDWISATEIFSFYFSHIRIWHKKPSLNKLKFEPKYCFLPSIKVSSPPLLALLPLLPQVFKLFEPLRLGLERERVELGHQFVPISLESLALCL